MQACNLLVFIYDFISLIADGGQQSIQLLIVDFGRIECIDAVDEVAKYIHVVGESIKWSAIETTVQSNVGWFGGHETEVVACLEVVPVLIDAWIVGNAQTVCHAIELIEGFALQSVAKS